MDHLDFIVLFLSISAASVGYGIAMTARNTPVHDVALQYRYFTVPTALFVLLEMVSYYLDNGAVAEVPLWYVLFHSHLSVTLLMLCSRQMVLLAAVFGGRAFSDRTIRQINIAWLCGYSVATLLLELDAAYGTNSFVIVLPVVVYLFGGFTAAAVILWHGSSSHEAKRQIRILAAIVAGTIVIFLEDLGFSVFDEVIFYPYAFLAINLFFVRYFGQVLGEFKRRGNRVPDVSTIAEEYDVSSREAEVLEHLARGQNRADIAEALFISENTVKTHIANLYRKVGVASRGELMKLIDAQLVSKRRESVDPGS